MKALDFFCGAGGLTRGLLDAGIEVVAGYDIDGSCRAAYEGNNSVRFVRADIGELTPDGPELKDHLDRTDDLLFAACAPCQPFSKQRRGGEGKHDLSLLLQFGELVAAVRPAWVLVENVPGIARGVGRDTLDRFRRTLDESGYRWTNGVLDAKDYGVPQNRRRYVLMARRGEARPELPERTHGGDRRPHRTVREAIGRFPPISAGGNWPGVPNHGSARISERNLERLRATPRDGGDRRSWPDHLWLACHRGDHAGHTDVYGRMAWDRPAPALTGRCNSISNGRYGHPEQDRALSLREAAAIQTFPDHYRFVGYNKAIARQIGNAVPVLLAEQLGKHIVRLARNDA